LLLSVSACANGVRRFPLREPLRIDTDLRPVHVPCKPDKEDPKHAICTPAPYESSFAWDGADNIVFRPVAQFFKVDPGEEAMNVNAYDEVADSAWFTNRIGAREMTLAEVIRGSCNDEVLDPLHDAPGSWLIDQGKPNGANPGFRVRVQGKGKFMLKSDVSNQPEKGTGAAAAASRFYYAAGWWAPCDSVVYIRPDLLKLKDGLTVTDNSGVTKPFDQPALDALLAKATKRDGVVRMVASKWLPGRTLGPFTYAGTRKDDPNDIIPHEDRRDLRGAKVLAAWLNHFDSREQNSMDTWMAVNEKDPDSSPGHIRHWYIDLGDCFGSEWDWEGITKALGFAYYLDIPYVLEDFLTFGIIERPWDRATRSKDGEIFAYFNSRDFHPHEWRGGYPNPTFNRMTELDGAWAARIIARFTRDHVDAALSVADFTNPKHHAFVLHHLLVRQRKIFERYFSKLSPIADLEVRGGSELCGVDLARKTKTFTPERYAYSASMWTGEDLAEGAKPAVRSDESGAVCVTLPHFAADGGEPDDSYARYAIVDVANGATPGPLRAHLYDLGPAKGYELVGIERPKNDQSP
jgi:hypothetical protein